MINVLKQIMFFCCSFMFIFIAIFGSFNLIALANTDKQNDQLIEKISRDFTKKFCNGIGFGLSKESAMNFADKENSLTFQKRNGFDDLNKKLLSIKIAYLVIDTCGYPLDLKGENGVHEFEKVFNEGENIKILSLLKNWFKL